MSSVANSTNSSLTDWLSVPRKTVVRPPAGKTACVVRYGGFGDMLQTANVLPGLKRQGFHVTVMTTPQGRHVIELDPHVDAWLIQDNDEVPNHQLCDYWGTWAAEFDRFVNFSESVEGTLLAMHGRANFYWPDWLRRRELNKNYLEWMSDLASVPYRSEARFYPSKEEEDRARAFRRKHPGFLMLIALGGSSVHKNYTWMDNVIAMALTRLPKAHIVTVGDMACKLLEQGWQNEPRVTCASAELDIREVLTLARHADLVFGPETGVLNSVAFERGVRKVILLSHSSRENLTKHWLATDVMEPVDTPCYPCHRLHYDRSFCHQHEESRTAMCQASIDPERAFRAISRCYEAWERKAA